MAKPLIVDNHNVVMIDLFTLKCSHCEHTFNMEIVKDKCPNCGEILFEKMTKPDFKSLFKQTLIAIGIDEKKVEDFMKGDLEVRDLGICTEMSVAVDLNFQIKFGGQFKSFFTKENFRTILRNNF